MTAPLRFVPRWSFVWAGTDGGDEKAPHEPDSPPGPGAPPAEGDAPVGESDSADPVAEPGPVESTADDLPEYEPLTPELVEDDAMRNDFMLRLVVVLLAFLLACTEINDTRTLVHVRTGQYIAEHGWLPPRTDVFSYTAADRPWINTNWLFDLFAAGVYGLGGAVGLTVAKAVLAAIAFYLVIQAGRSQVSTWWGSICAALALLACVPQFTMRPEIVTLVGIAAVLWILRRWQGNPDARAPWMLVPVILLWSNLDPRAFLGVALIVLFALGESVGAWLDRSSLMTGTRRAGLWIAAAACLVAALVNPFGWHALAAPLALYAGEYGGWRSLIGEEPRNLASTLLQNYPMTSPVFWNSLNVHTLSALALLAAAAVSFVLNRRNVPLSHVLAFLGFLGFAVGGSHELAAASIVWAVLAAINAQQWYLQSFRQTYSIELSERLFSTGGRAVTALALFAVAYLAVSGRLLGRDGPRTGVGFDQPIAAAISGMRDDLSTLEPEDRAFNFLLLQGDLMIWLGHPVFADGRLPLYTHAGEPDLIDLHGRVRAALHSADPSPISRDRELWRETFDGYGVTHAVPYLGSARPNYQSYFTMLLAPDWQLTHLGPISAVFSRRDAGEVPSKGDERIDFARLAFETSSDEVPTRPDWARAGSWYETTLFLPEEERLNDVQLARHYSVSLQFLMQLTMQQGPAELFGRADENAAALAALAIRRANQGLARDPSNAAAYQVLGDVYVALQGFEGRSAPSPRLTWPKRRFLQSVAAYRQALVAEPEGPNSNAIRQALRDVYLSQGMVDLALELARELADKAPDIDALTAEQLRELEQNRVAIEQLSTQVTAVEEEIENAQSAGDEPNHLAASQFARNQGCVRLALQHLGQVPEETLSPAERLQMQLHRSTLLLEAGEAEQAQNELATFEGYAETYPDQFGGVSWRPHAALAALANGDYPRAIDLWNSELRDYEQARMSALMDTLPFASASVERFNTNRRELWPVERTLAGMAASASHDVAADVLLNLAACYLEMGQPERARSLLERLLKTSPESPVRPVAAGYLSYLTEDPIDPFPPSAYIPVWTEMFAPEPQE